MCIPMPASPDSPSPDANPHAVLLASMSPDELARLMRLLGYRTQSDMARAIGVSRSAVSIA